MAQIQVQCSYCRRLAQMRPAGLHLTLRFIPPSDWDATTLEYFCIWCHQENTVPVASDVAELIKAGGSSVSTLTIPQEFLEHPGADVPAVCLIDLDELRQDLHGDDRWPAEWGPA